MGTSSSGAEFSGKINRWAANMGKLPKELQRHNARTAETTMGAAVRAMTGDGNLSRVRSGKGARVSVRTKDAGKSNTAVSFRGPLPLVENPNEAHLIGGGRGRTTTRGGREFVSGLSRSYDLNAGQRLNIGGTWVTGPVIHPGTRGKHAWKKARDGVMPKLILADTHRAVLGTAKAVF